MQQVCYYSDCIEVLPPWDSEGCQQQHLLESSAWMRRQRVVPMPASTQIPAAMRCKHPISWCTYRDIFIFDQCHPLIREILIWISSRRHDIDARFLPWSSVDNFEGHFASNRRVNYRWLLLGIAAVLQCHHRLHRSEMRNHLIRIRKLEHDLHHTF